MNSTAAQKIKQQLAAEAARVLPLYPQIGTLQGANGTRYYAYINGVYAEHISAEMLATEIQMAEYTYNDYLADRGTGREFPCGEFPCAR